MCGFSLTISSAGCIRTWRTKKVFSTMSPISLSRPGSRRIMTESLLRLRRTLCRLRPRLRNAKAPAALRTRRKKRENSKMIATTMMRTRAHRTMSEPDLGYRVSKAIQTHIIWLTFSIFREMSNNKRDVSRTQALPNARLTLHQQERQTLPERATLSTLTTI